jgi:hypothetical protein
MTLDLLDRLMEHIVGVTESLQDIEGEIDLATWQPFSRSKNAEKASSSLGIHAGDGKEPRKGMATGIHRSVC